MLAKQGKQRLRKYVDEMMEASAQGLSLLEKKAISSRTEKYYTQEVEDLMQYVTVNRRSFNITKAR